MNGKNIKFYRQKDQLSLSDLAQRANISVSYLSTLEKNKNANPGLLLLTKLSEALKVSIEDLIYGPSHRRI
ncbi:helix-turn-helix protein [Sinobaca qinghaiensis]|uniref:Helix-turn-helix protein n=2 Tax=Sinobaca qinghaiensis TaxID=342944 RepID=A0A419UWX9_9BACL|nr:helix-turn-helix protein [Sinobaca qinghaiensis]